MTDTTPTPADIAPSAPSTPPWGDDFDAGRAWTLITNLRDEAKGLKQKLSDAETGARTASETHETTASELAATRRELWVARALRSHAVPDTLVAYLDGDDEAAVMQRAEHFAAATAKPEPEPEAPTPELVAPPELRRRPVAIEMGLTPGHGGGDVFESSLGAADIVAAIRG